MSELTMYLFNEEDSRFAGAVFSELVKAESWIQRHALSGTLTAYPIDIGVYDWAVEEGYFLPKRDSHRTASFIGGFTTARQEHYHYKNGAKA